MPAAGLKQSWIMENQTKSETEPFAFADFLALSVHDMKNSLGMLIGALENTIKEARVSDSPLSPQLGQMEYEAKRLNNNLLQLLCIYKISNRLYPVDIQEHPIRAVLEEIVMQNRPLLEFRQIKLALDCQSDSVWYFDKELLSGALNNALNNAIQHTADQLRLVARVVDGQLEVRVEDNGGGYPDALLHGVVSANKGINFYRGSTGLGMYFSALVANLHQNNGHSGSLTIENGGAYGGGCFVLRLP